MNAPSIGPRETTSPEDAFAKASVPDRTQEIAQEFEALVIHQMLRQIRREGAWNDTDGAPFGTRLVEMIDVELARQLAMGGGLGLTDVLLPALASSGQELADTISYNTSVARAATVEPLPGLPDPPERLAVTQRLEAGVPDATKDSMLEKAREVVTSPFGWRQDPLVGDARFHTGVDLQAAYGDEVAAALPGTVTHAGSEGGYGLTVVIEHEGGVATRSAHLSSLLVEVGESVSTGQAIGRAGSSGRATGPHLHFEVSHDGRRVDPMSHAGDLAAPLKKL